MVRLSPALLLVLVFSTLLAQSQTKRGKPAQPHGPRIYFSTERQDAGDIPYGPDHYFVFPFRNCGDEPLYLNRVNYPADWPKDPVMPGKWDTIRISYMTQGRPGPFSKAIFVGCNDTASLPKGRAWFELSIKGRVVQGDDAKQ